MPEAPPSVKRPDCAAATPVEPKKNESGSTTVLCWLEAFVNGSVAIFRTGMVALAARVSTSAAVAADPRARAARLPCIAPPLETTADDVRGLLRWRIRGKQDCSFRQSPGATRGRRKPASRQIR